VSGLYLLTGVVPLAIAYKVIELVVAGVTLP
jgi:hypothetical protein